MSQFLTNYFCNNNFLTEYNFLSEMFSVELSGWMNCLVEKIWFGIFSAVYRVFTFQAFCLKDLNLSTQFCRFGLANLIQPIWFSPKGAKWDQ